MKSKKLTLLILIVYFCGNIFAQRVDPTKPDPNPPREIKGMKLVWNDEFNYTGKPDSNSWRYERGFVRNQELQWYQKENANCSNGRLLIEARREKIKNPNFNPERKDWRSAEFAEYSSASIQTRGFHQFQFGRFEIRARIDTTKGSWPAIWTLGTSGGWPGGGEIDIMEFYRTTYKEEKGTEIPIILANIAWLGPQGRGAKWNTGKKPVADFTSKDRDWVKKYHVWRMDWTKDSISLFLDDLLLNSQKLSETINPNGFNPFMQPHYILLNLAIGGAGKDPSKSKFPITYEVDYVRVYQDK
jgi:beta-glucanase (GH16 family)